MVFLLSNDGKAEAVDGFEFNKTPGLSVALGCFDGVHRGHRRLLERAVAEKELLPAVWTFSEPVTLPFIDSVPDRLSLFGKNGIRLAVCEDFKAVRSLSPEDFVRRLTEELKVKLFVSGEDFRFGIDRTGDAEALKRYAEKYGARAEIIPPIMAGSEKISSSLIRRLLALGDVRKASELLGRPFSVTGRVLHGKGLGRTVKLPTVNQGLQPGRVELKHGVYDSVTVINGKRLPSVTNIGVRPTVNSNEGDVTCETHIIGESLDAYGENITVELYRFAREEKRFKSLEDLRTAVEADIQRAKAEFDARENK